MNNNTVLLYGLSTCMHCRQAKNFLETKCVSYECVYVDKLIGEARSNTIADVKRHNPRLSFPTLVINSGERVIVGFQEQELVEALGV